MTIPRTRWLAIVLVGLALSSRLAAAQGVRITGVTTMDYEELQPMAADSVLASTTTPDTGLLRQTPNGTIVECVGVDAYCSYYHSTSRVNTVPVLQDLTLTGWGLGEGISVYADAEVRTSMGSDAEVLPLASEHFDLIAAYAELARSIVRVRLGRQWTNSPLGYYAYDGGSALVAPLRGVTAQLYGGWGLAQGLTYERTSSLISAVEDLAPTNPGYIFGGSVDYRPSPIGGVSLQYQREIETNWSGLYSDRIAGAGDLRVWRAMLDAQLIYDFAAEEVNNAELRAQMPIGTQWDVSAQVRHYLPFFELWSIWGAFSPVGYNQGLVSAAWRTTDQRFRIEASVDYRKYDNTDAAVSFLPLVTDGFDVGLDGSWQVLPAWTLLGGYHLLAGVGDSRSDVDAGFRWRIGTRGSLGLTGSAFQSVDEFSVGTGRVLALSANGSFRLDEALQAHADVGIYHHVGDDTPQIANWDQRRATIQLTWTVGRDPGLARMHP